jgi:hypothetical protein
VLIGVAGANYYAHAGSAVFTTEDRDLFLQPDPNNLVRCWAACEANGLELWSEREPLDMPRDRSADSAELHVELTLVMAGFDFETVWSERRLFVVDDVEIPVARLLHIVTSKHAAGREKGRLFLAAHREVLEELLRGAERKGGRWS